MYICVCVCVHVCRGGFIQKQRKQNRKEAGKKEAGKGGEGPPALFSFLQFFALPSAGAITKAGSPPLRRLPLRQARFTN